MTVRLIIGPPGAGKSTYVQQHRGPGDWVVDYDTFLAEGDTPEQARRSQRRMEAAASAYQGDVWIVRTLAAPADREEFIERVGAEEILTLDPGDEICRQRVLQRDGDTTKYEGIARWRAHNPKKEEHPMTEQNAAENTPATEAPETEQDQTTEEVTPESKARREAANYRHQLREAEAERDHWKERAQNVQRRDIERMALDGGLVTNPAGLWKLGLNLEDTLTEDGDIDQDKAQQAVRSIAKEYGLTPKGGLPEEFGTNQLYEGQTEPAWVTSFMPSDK